MPVIVSMLRGVNLAAHNRIKMDALREVYESLGLRDAQSYVQSGNVVFRCKERCSEKLAQRIGGAIEERFGFCPAVILRSPAEMRDVIARNPFAGRNEIEPSRFLVLFLARDPGAMAREKVLAMKTAPEELRFDGRELYIYFPNGMARPKLSWPAIERAIATPSTGRNWNSVTKLLAMAEQMEAAQ